MDTFYKLTKELDELINVMWDCCSKCLLHGEEPAIEHYSDLTDDCYSWKVCCNSLREIQKRGRYNDVDKSTLDEIRGYFYNEIEEYYVNKIKRKARNKYPDIKLFGSPSVKAEFKKPPQYFIQP